VKNNENLMTAEFHLSNIIIYSYMIRLELDFFVLRIFPLDEDKYLLLQNQSWKLIPQTKY